jgi:hypothetical protein
MIFTNCGSKSLHEIVSLFKDTTEIKIDETTELVTESVEAATDSTEESIVFPCPDCGPTNEIDAVTIQPPVESATPFDLESVVIDLGVDRLKMKDPEVGLKIVQSAVSDEETILTTEIPQVIKSSTEILSEPVEDAARDTTGSTPIQEKVEILGDAVTHAELTPTATTSQEEILSVESGTTQPVADPVIHVGLKEEFKNLTKEKVGASLILLDPENVSQDTATPSVQQKFEISADSDTTQTAMTSLEETLSTESATLRPETNSEFPILLKADFKTPSDEWNEGTEAIIMDGVITIQPELDNAVTTESVTILLKNNAEATPMTMDDLTIETTSVPVNEEFRTIVTDVVEDVTQSTVDFTDSGTDSTDLLSDPVDEIVLMEPQLVKIFDPSVDVEATTFLAEANMQTESDDIATTESFYQADDVERIEEEETLTTTDESIALTIGTESGTEPVTSESSTELMSETTTALPVSVKLSPPSSGIANAPVTKKRSYKGYKVYR